MTGLQRLAAAWLLFVLLAIIGAGLWADWRVTLGIVGFVVTTILTGTAISVLGDAR
jgi:hypothetical protein